MTSVFSDLFFHPEPIVWVQQLFGPGWQDPFRAVDLLATTWGVLFAIGLALWVWGRQDAYALAAIVVVEAGLNLVLNQLFSVPRPSAPEIVQYEQIALDSFPSGHVFTATVLWGLLWARRRVPLWLTSLVVLGVAVGRLYLGTHYLADVVAGVLLGVALIWVFRRLWPRLCGWLAERSYGAFATAGLLVLGGAAVWVAASPSSNHFIWNAVGAIAGGVLALLVEWRRVRYAPTDAAVSHRALKIALGVIGLAPLVLVERITAEDELALGTALTALGALWALWLAPALFARLDRSRARLDARRARAWLAGRSLGSAVLAVLVLLVFYGVAVEPRLLSDLEEHTATVPALPAAWQGERLALLADFQIGMWWANENMVRRLVERAVAERPAAVLLGGDFIYKPGGDARDEMRRALELLRPLLGSGIPVYAVLGNHDWSLNKQDDPRNPQAARQVEQMLSDAGVRVLTNEAVALPAPGGGGGPPLYLVGIGSRWAENDEPLAALDRLPAGAARVVFMHNPDSFREIPAHAAPLALAAHTHGGQIALPFTPGWSWLEIVTEGEAHADGWIEPGFGAPGNRLYVNRGIGFSTMPIRINTVPELTMMRLERGR